MNSNISIPPEFAWGARLGYAARGVMYLMIGGMATLAALGSEGKTTGSKGALATLSDEPHGQVMIITLIIGLLCYSAWRAVQSIKDTDQHGNNIKAIAIRGGLLVSAITHLFLAYWAGTVLLGNDASDSSNSEGFLKNSWGQWVFCIAAVCVFGAGIAHIVKGWNAGFEKFMDIPHQQKYWAKPLCRFGLVSRGAVYCIIGIFLFSSAWVAGAGEISGVGEALTWLQGQLFGSWLLGVTAIGLFSFGIYSALEAFYRRIDP
ncbi:hypothetical protein TDB9533_00602 [Thalassocella blandensis]|nr:hypothetical protein TDB9533_00602 [Thalassocella blandensis]